VLNAYRQGQTDQTAQRKNLLQQQIGSTVASQGYLPAADVAFAGGDIQTGIDLQNIPVERLTKINDLMGRAALAANTPEDWNKVISTFEPVFGSKEMDPYRDFSSKDQWIAQSMSVAEQAKLALEKQKLNQPDLSMTEIFTPGGGTQKGTFDKNTCKFTPMGGEKKTIRRHFFYGCVGEHP
jgi:hypothetical protein